MGHEKAPCWKVQHKLSKKIIAAIRFTNNEGLNEKSLRDKRHDEVETVKYCLIN